MVTLELTNYQARILRTTLLRMKKGLIDGVDFLEHHRDKDYTESEAYKGTKKMIEVLGVVAEQLKNEK